ncbi:hypothetical protein K458DRAFT_387302 [Lentithecium fluviatile CBS 122367]|uniref:Uncharacterized protein n=1 Tax=Lentithecium fluviatile CBS 122367 TaxID=1168545 RepID=A0A6G1J7X5_9PLEO|nr:hypothetical protein K458DRAFT_387302 [Lentithecium fluviatile CBS 122367]
MAAEAARARGIGVVKGAECGVRADGVGVKGDGGLVGVEARGETAIQRARSTRDLIGYHVQDRAYSPSKKCPLRIGDARIAAWQHATLDAAHRCCRQWLGVNVAQARQQRRSQVASCPTAVPESDIETPVVPVALIHRPRGQARPSMDARESFHYCA